MSVFSNKKHSTGTVVSQTFNRFGVKKQMDFLADSGQEISLFSKRRSGDVIRMSQEEYLALPDHEKVWTGDDPIQKQWHQEIYGDE